MFGLDLIVISSLSVIFVSISLLWIIFLYNLDEKNKNIFVKIGIYVIITISIYLLLLMFQHNTIMIKNDILDTIENTEKYNGFYDSISVLQVTLFGSILGGVYYKLTKYIKNHNMKSRKW